MTGAAADEIAVATNLAEMPGTQPPTLDVEIDESNAGGDRDTYQRSKFRLRMIVLALNTVLFVAALDQTVVATSIPTITKDLDSAAGYTWIGGAYLLASAASGPLWTKGSDIWGRKPALLGSVFVFATGSLIAALAIDMSMVIAARAIQGVGCGGLFQLVTVSTSDLFSLRERALIFGLQGGVYAVAGSAGPLIGGAFSQFVTWRWCFWINLPVCGVSFLLLATLLDTHNPRTPFLQGLKAVDWAGAFTMLSMSLLFLLGLEFGGSVFPWNSATVICLIVIGLLMTGAFLYSEKKIAKYPLIPLSVFKLRSNNAVILLAIGHSMINTGVEYYLPLYFQSVKQQSPFFSGLLLLPLTIMAAVTDITSGILIHKIGRYIELIWTGVVAMTLGTGLYISLWSDTPLSHVIGFEVVSGLGVALLFQTPVLVIHNTVKQADVASATASLGFLKALATATSVVAGGAVFKDSMDNRQSLLVMSGIPQSTLVQLTGNNAAANVGIIETIADAGQRLAVLDAYAWSVRNIFVFYVCVSGLTIFASIFIKQGNMSSEHKETKTGLEHLSTRDEKHDAME